MVVGGCCWLLVVLVQTMLYDMCLSPYTPMSMQLIRVAEHLGVETPGVPATPSDKGTTSS